MFTFPNAEALIIDYLAPILGIPVGAKAPGTGTEFAKVFRTGGPRTNPVTDGAILTFEVYATRNSRAVQLMELARAAVFALAGTRLGTTSIKSVVEVGVGGSLPDPVFPALTRYTFTTAVHMRGRQETTP